MSLKAFHVVFILASLALCFGMSAWAFWQYSDNESSSQTHLLLGTFCLISGICLGIYGRYFLRKLRDVSYL
ncbi:MAG: hypothetical protein FJ405_09680 [Verrucomicrobia bacterium]|nr:hypothetical protein [Verrucomicrobiota bacterium]